MEMMIGYGGAGVVVGLWAMSFLVVLNEVFNGFRN